MRGVVVLSGLAAGAADVGHAGPAPAAGLWSLFAAQGDFSAGADALSRVRWAFDGQARFQEDANGFNQSLFRPSAGFDVAWRMRELVKIGVPIGTAGRFRLVGYDEVFVNANDANAGFGIPIGDHPSATIEIGYLNQFIRRSRGEDRVNHILSLNLFFSL